jgi:type II secretory pathway pseudopilin PulG
MTLIELLVSITILIVVMGATLTMLESASRTAPKEEARSGAVQTAQVQLERMTRELRQAVRFNASSYNYVDFDVLVGGQTRRVVFDCRGQGSDPRYRGCKRSEAPQGGELGAGVGVVDRLLNGTDDTPGRVFTADDPLQPRFIRVRIEVPASGERTSGYAHKVVLDDGVYLRNLNLG